MHSKQTPIRQCGEHGLCDVGEILEIVSPIPNMAAATLIPEGSETDFPSNVTVTVSCIKSVSVLNIESSIAEFWD